MSGIYGRRWMRLGGLIGEESRNKFGPRWLTRVCHALINSRRHATLPFNYDFSYQLLVLPGIASNKCDISLFLYLYITADKMCTATTFGCVSFLL